MLLQVEMFLMSHNLMLGRICLKALLSLTEAIDTNDVESSPKEAELISSNFERPPTPPFRRIGRNRKPVYRL